MITTAAAAALTFGQAAARLGVDVTTVRRWVGAEQCPTVRVGNATRIPAAWVDGLIAAGWPV
ncbi:helix-turn-helix domain-containing protein [Mycobacterium sp. Y57]|uniref:excisionase family DNA-binding protein n=1 Tax=Mycolicibacterium xanthum TaxID=2796469 RepID=UPI001C85FCBC|nr:helix-turn-helix domain-containing protein [Mycolicibacterium xanthum]MBX7433577.1 helix-turn-helix domain-containing protein [Mycolicibacterium xanthum]